jgi:hypothetical protein
MEKSTRFMITGLILLIVGVVLPFSMVLGLITPTYFLSFLSYSSSTAGLITGFIGIAQHMGARKHSERER